MKTMRWGLILAGVLGCSVIGQAQIQDRDKDQEGDRTGDPVEAGEPRSGYPDFERPQLPDELKQKVAQIRTGRQELLESLQALLEVNQEATEDQRRQAVQEWREQNEDAIAEQRRLAEQVRWEVEAHQQENRPRNAGPPDDGSGVGEPTLEQLKEQRQTALQSRQHLQAELQNASEEQRRQLMTQQREQQMEQNQLRIDEVQARSRQLDREESVAHLRRQLQDEAETLRTQNRERDREQTVQEREAAQIRLNVREQVQDVEVSRPDRPDRPERPDAGTSGSSDRDSRREQLTERHVQ